MAVQASPVAAAIAVSIPGLTATVTGNNPGRPGQLTAGAPGGAGGAVRAAGERPAATRAGGAATAQPDGSDHQRSQRRADRSGQHIQPRPAGSCPEG